jgi:predicted dehydrogenase
VNKIKLALIGAGDIAKVHIQGVLAHSDKVTCVALCDISAENLAHCAAKFPSKPNCYQDWHEMLSQEAELDAVIIALPHHLHAPAILAAATSGKHILCEKPMCMNLAEADEILAAVRNAGIIYMSAHNQLFTPVVREAKRLLDEGFIGQLRWLRTQDCFVADAQSMANTWRGRLASQGGGELIDTGYHPSYLLLYLADATPVTVHCNMSRFHMNIEGEDTASVTVRFDSGVLGEVLTSWAMPLPYGSHSIHLMGDKGELFGSGDVLFFRPTGFQEPARLNLNPIASTYTEELAHFVDCLQQGKKPLHGPEDGKAVLELILRATESAAGWQESLHKAFEA